MMQETLTLGRLENIRWEGRGMRRVSGKLPASAQAMTQAGVGCSDVNGTDKVSCSWSEATFSRKADDGGLSPTLHTS